jgi:hypothetical protein
MVTPRYKKMRRREFHHKRYTESPRKLWFCALNDLGCRRLHELARIFKGLWSPGIDSKESIPPAYVAWRAGTITLFLLGAYSPHRFFKNSSSEHRLYAVIDSVESLSIHMTKRSKNLAFPMRLLGRNRFLKHLVAMSL